MKKIVICLVLLCILFIPYNVKAQDSFTMGIVNDYDVNVRSGPGTNYSIVRTNTNSSITLSRPESVEVLSTSNGWSKIQFLYSGTVYTGYIYSIYLNTTTKSIDTNYYNTLIGKGFPNSYADKLAKIHAIHPNWDFEVSSTNINLSDAVSYESSPIYKNLIQTTNVNLLSTDSAAYSNGNYVQFQPGWYAPNRSTLTYYMDPRNFLDDGHIFMFEQLSYNSKLTEEDVQKVLNGTFMQGSFSYNGQSITYAKTFLEVGKKYNVNPIHLVARVLQEQGTSGYGITAVMKDTNGTTYYNYYNFNATGSSVAEILNNALNYAKRNNWTNPYLAIEGGAEGIADDYISNNQDTLYYQKFNIVGSSRFSHQYMQNVAAPYTESYNTYVSYYKTNLIDIGFIFKIPVYSDMGEIAQIATKSNNNNLTKLSISNCNLTPTFDSAITSYYCSVSSSTSSVNVDATKADTKSSVSGTGNKTLVNGENKVEIKVTAEDGSTKTYTVTINKQEAKKEVPNDIVNSVGYKNSNNNLTGFTLGSDVSSIIKNIKNKNTNAIVKIMNSSNKEITTGLVSTGQRIIITNNSITETYNVIVKGDTNGDGKISAIDYSKVKLHILNTNKLSDSYNIAADTNGDGKISAIDYSKIKSHILNINKLAQ